MSSKRLNALMSDLDALMADLDDVLTRITTEILGIDVDAEEDLLDPSQGRRHVHGD